MDTSNIANNLITASIFKGGNMYEIINCIVYLIFIQQLVIFLPKILEYLKNNLTGVISKKTNNIISKEKTSSVVIERKA